MVFNSLPVSQTKLFINNEYVSAKSGTKFSIYNPVDETLVTDSVPVAGQEDVDAAVEGALKAFKNGPWKTFTAAQRTKCMLKFADLIDANAEKLGMLESIAMGVPPATATAVVKGGAEQWRYYAGWTDKLAGETYPEENGVYRIVRYEPIGVCAGISAWNGTHTFFSWKCAPAVAVGNTVVFKGSEKSPLGVLAYGELVKEAGFPPGVIQLLSGPGSTGAMLSSHMKIAKISFTGSSFTGKKIQEMATKSNMKRCTLELGGKSPAIVFNDADLENAVAQYTAGFLVVSGQVCAAASRLYLQEEIAPKFLEGLKAAFKAVASSVRDPSSVHPLQQFGPLADRAQYERVMSFIQSGKDDAQLVTGGTRVGDKGFYVEPTIFLNPKPDASIYKEEIFGPVTVVKTFKTEDEVLELANDTVFGLSATIYTSSLPRALRMSSNVEAGTVGINSAFVPSPQTPFGGFKQSGIGRESGLAGILAYVETKSIHININA